MNEQLRNLPSVEELTRRLEPRAGRIPRPLIVAEVRRVLEAVRKDLVERPQGGVPDMEILAEAALAELIGPSLERVINATGVILHTNLGRAPLAGPRGLTGYSNLEYDLKQGRRGGRDVHAGALLERLLGAAAIAVNNNAAAVYLALRALAAGGEVLVSRGELIEIGDGFRIPDIMRASGAILREVGTTNRTRLEDYREAFTPATRLVLRVHQSNFRMSGFTARPALSELAALARGAGVPLYEDLGSGSVTDLRQFGISDPLAPESLRSGADLISFSGDKLMGGPQAGILAGKAELIARLRKDPMYRALRLDKLVLQALESTLRELLLEHWDQIPTLRMIRMAAEAIRQRALRLLEAVPGELWEGRSLVGGGSAPDQSLDTWLVALDSTSARELEQRLRLGQPPVVARIERDRVVIDLRTVLPDEEAKLAYAIQEAMINPAEL